MFIDQASILLSYFNLEEALEVESAQGNNDAVTFIDLYSNYKSQQEVTNIKSKTFKTKAEFDRAVAEQVMFYKEYSLNHI